MRPHSLEYDPGFLHLVDQQPVGLDVAFAPTNIVADKAVVTVDWVEGLSGQERSGDDLELVEVLAATLGSLDVSLELPGVGRAVTSNTQLLKHLLGALIEMDDAKIVVHRDDRVRRGPQDPAKPVTPGAGRGQGGTEAMGTERDDPADSGAGGPTEQATGQTECLCVVRPQLS